MFSERALKEIKSEVCHKVSFSSFGSSGAVCVCLYNCSHCSKKGVFNLNMQIEMELLQVLFSDGLKYFYMAFLI